jgi:RNA polymerase sigma-70 factor (sigma-E family)
MAREHDQAFVEFADWALPKLTRTAYLLCGDWHRGEDAAQEALVKLYVAWPRVDRREGVMAYARKTLVRLLIDDSRRPWRREIAQAEPRDPTALMGDASGEVNDRMLVVRALQLVSGRRRACLVLRYFSDLSVADTARLLGCTEGTVKSQTSRGLVELRTALQGAGVTDNYLREGASAP